MTQKIGISIRLSGRGGELDRTEMEFDHTVYRHGTLTAHSMMQERIHAAIAAWTLHPGDTIEIFGNQAAFDAL